MTTTTRFARGVSSPGGGVGAAAACATSLDLVAGSGLLAFTP
jgi:hypothetical protein